MAPLTTHTFFFSWRNSLKSLSWFSHSLLVFFFFSCNKNQSMEALIFPQISSFLPFFVVHD